MTGRAGVGLDARHLMSTGRTIALVGVAALVALCPSALASRPMTRSERHALVRAEHPKGPNGRRLSWRCIEGVVSTIDPRYGATHLTNSPRCVARVGGASGASALYRRPSPTSRKWRALGIDISNNCLHESAIPDAVLRDLGCENLYWNYKLSPVGLVPVRFGMTPDEIEQATGESVRVGSVVNECTFWGLPGLPRGVQLVSFDGRLGYVEISRPGLATTRDVTVGDSIRQLRARYGRRLRHGKSASLSAASQRLFVDVKSRGVTYTMEFDIYKRRVSFISAGARETIQNFGECA